MCESVVDVVMFHFCKSGYKVSKARPSGYQMRQKTVLAKKVLVGLYSGEKMQSDFRKRKEKKTAKKKKHLEKVSGTVQYEMG